MLDAIQPEHKIRLYLRAITQTALIPMTLAVILAVLERMAGRLLLLDLCERLSCPSYNQLFLVFKQFSQSGNCGSRVKSDLSQDSRDVLADVLVIVVQGVDQSPVALRAIAYLNCP